MKLTLRHSLSAVLIAVGLLILWRNAPGPTPMPTPTTAVTPITESSTLRIDDGLAEGTRLLRRYLLEGRQADLQAARAAFDNLGSHQTATVLYQAFVREAAGDLRGRSEILHRAGVNPDVYEFYVHDRAKLGQVLDVAAMDQCGRRIEVLRQAAALCVRTVGRAPARLEDLVPTYLDRLRPCPGTGEGNYEWSSDGTTFQVRCRQHPAPVEASDSSGVHFTGMDPVTDLLAYVQIAQGLFDRTREHWVPMLVQAGGVRPGQTLADLGCGVGVFTLPLARAVGPKGKVYAVDINQSVLDCVRFLADRQPDLDIETVKSRVQETGLPAAAVDVAYLIHVYHVLVDQEDPRNEADFQRNVKPFLDSVHRSLKPGGRLVVVDTRPLRPEDRAHVDPALVREQLERVGFRRASGRTFDGEQFVEVFQVP